MQAVTLILEGEHNVEVKEQVLCFIVLIQTSLDMKNCALC